MYIKALHCSLQPKPTEGFSYSNEYSINLELAERLCGFENYFRKSAFARLDSEASWTQAIQKLAENGPRLRIYLMTKIERHMPENPFVKHVEIARSTIMSNLRRNRRQHGNRDAHRRRLPDGSTLKKGSSWHEHHYSFSFG
jgi:hypothetical protein